MKERDLANAGRVTAATRAHPQPDSAPLSRRLTKRKPAGYVIPEPVLATLAFMQGNANRVAELLRQEGESPVLFAGAIQLDSTGLWFRNFDVGYHAAALSNGNDAGNVTVASGAPGDPGRPPSSGAGVHVIRAKTAATFGVVGNTLSVYGTANAIVTLSVFSRWVPPAYGPA